MKRAALFSTISLLVLLPLLTSAQELEFPDTGQELEVAGTGIIRGMILDTSPRRNPISKVEISYVGPGMARGEVVSDATGAFEIRRLKPGTYILNADKRGYAPREGLNATAIPGTDSVIEIKMRKQETPITSFRRLGLMGPLLVLCSIAMFGGIVIMIIYIILRAGKFSQSKSQINIAMSRVTTSLQNENVVEAVSICEEVGGVANMLKSGLIRAQALIDKRAGAPSEIQIMLEKEKVQETLEETGFTAKEAFRFHWEFFVVGFAAIGLMAQLLGLLGTVTGIIRAFTVIALEGTGDPQQLAGGISEALLTSTAAMMILIPCLVLCGVVYIVYIIFERAANNHISRRQGEFVETINSQLLSRSS